MNSCHVNSRNAIAHFALATVASLGLGACASTPGETSAEFEPRPTTDANIRLTAPSLDLELQRVMRRDTGFQRFEETTDWSANQGGQALIAVTRLDPTGRYSFNSRNLPSLRASARNWFKGKNVSIDGQAFAVSTKSRPAEALRVAVDQRECAFMRRIEGNIHGDGMVGGGESLGTTMITGYYCVPAQASLRDADLHAFAAGISVK